MPTFHFPNSSQATPLTITPLDGPLVQFGPITLDGRALPYQGTTWETQQRVKTKYYPGNPVATQQLMGPVEVPQTFTGIWKDRFLGNGVARQLARTFEDLCRSGTLVEVSWGASTLPDGTQNEAYTRRGVVSSFKATPDRPQDVQYEIMFEWRGRDEATAPPISASSISNPREGATELRTLLQDVVDGLDAFFGAPSALVATFGTDVLDRIDDETNTLLRAIQILGEPVRAANTAIGVTQEAASRIASAGNASGVALRNIAETIDGMIRTTYTALDRALDTIDVQERLLALFTTTIEAAETSYRRSAEMDALKFPEVLREVRVPSGTDLRDLAFQYYGDADLWYAIADFNGLSSSRVPDNPPGPSDQPGFPIRVPQRTLGRTGDLRTVVAC